VLFEILNALIKCLIAGVFLQKKCKDTSVIIFYVESDNTKEKNFLGISLGDIKNVLYFLNKTLFFLILWKHKERRIQQSLKWPWNNPKSY